MSRARSEETKAKIREAALKQWQEKPPVKKRDLLDFTVNYAISKGGKCLSDLAESYETKVKLQCVCGNIWSTMVKTILYEETWCPKCPGTIHDESRNKHCQLCSSAFEDRSKKNNRRFCSTYCQQKKWVDNHAGVLKENKKEYYEANKEHIKDNVTKWMKNNKDKVKIYRNKYKAKTPLTFNERIKHNLRTRINGVLNGKLKGGSAVSDLGCSIEELKKHLELQFVDGMNWNNYGRDGWHIDHILPLSSFDLQDPEQLAKACHYSNLQPLWARDNISKSDKIPEGNNK